MMTTWSVVIMNNLALYGATAEHRQDRRVSGWTTAKGSTILF